MFHNPPPPLSSSYHDLEEGNLQNLHQNYLPQRRPWDAENNITAHLTDSEYTNDYSLPQNSEQQVLLFQPNSSRGIWLSKLQHSLDQRLFLAILFLICSGSFVLSTSSFFFKLYWLFCLPFLFLLSSAEALSSFMINLTTTRCEDGRTIVNFLDKARLPNYLPDWMIHFGLWRLESYLNDGQLISLRNSKGWISKAQWQRKIFCFGLLTSVLYYVVVYLFHSTFQTNHSLIYEISVSMGCLFLGFIEFILLKRYFLVANAISFAAWDQKNVIPEYHLFTLMESSIFDVFKFV